ncbi:SCP2 sterol-binding domain-containing protein [Sporobolomyces salmoneus]|uniref:SCP2 sterol-binding domain-containing protein n=1 Tax=Sporobolomyces salmoneus TaxID=183962 RepID=UPI00316BFC21
MSSPPGPDNQALSDRLIKAALNDPLIYHPSFDSSRVFALISVLLNSPSSPKKQLIRSMKTVYLFSITSNSNPQETARWFVDMKAMTDGAAKEKQKKGILRLLKPSEKPPLKPDVTITLSDKDLVGLANGSLNPMKLWEAKRIKVRGDLDKALRVEKILSQEREKLEALRTQNGGENKKKREKKEVWGERKPVVGMEEAERVVKAKL